MPVPRLEGTLAVAGPDREVEIFRDDSGVPHVRAATMHDAFFGQGFVHAQDRLWQMEYDRRRSGGRLAELLGARALAMDVFVRRMGIDRSARADHDALDAPTRAMLEAYTAGVNAFLAGETARPRELELLGIDAPPWEPWQCGAVFKVRHVLMGVFDSKLWRARLADSLGPRGAFVPGTPHGREDLLIVPVGASEVWNAPADDALATAAAPDGSNNWAVHGSRTASGKPLVAGDPHRTLEAPNVYYQNHIACPEFDAIGFSMPGVPGIFHFGHNAHVAWCVTHAMADTQDLYVERFDGEGRCERDGEWVDAPRRREVVAVRDGADVEIEIVTTHNGPVVIGDPDLGTAISLRWTGTDRPNPTLRAVGAMLLARSVGELDEAMRDWVDPCNSLVMADVDGDIGYLHRGRVPVRAPANAWTPVPGWTSEHSWRGDVPFEELPRLRNPGEGIIVTANNRVCGNDYPHHLGTDYSQPGRARRILERLMSLEDATASDMAAIHGDRVSLPSRAFADLLPQSLTGDWDGAMEPDATAPSVYATARDKLAEALLDREPLSHLAVNPYEQEPYPTPAHTRIRTALPRLVDTDLVTAEDWTEAVRRALVALEEQLGPDERTWSWGRLHVTRTVHPLSRVFPELAGELNPPSVACGGDGDCVQAGSSELGVWVQHSSVARYVFDLSDWDGSGWIVPLGSSGHPESPHYADQAQDWANVRLRPMLYSWDRIEADTGKRQVLVPAR